MTQKNPNQQREAMETAMVEIRAAEGGDDAKLLVEDQLAIYVRFAARRCL